MFTSQAKDVDATLSELAALKISLEADSQEAAVELIGEASELLELQRGEVARLKAQVRWLEGKPYRSKPEKVPAGQLAFDLIAMMKKGSKEGEPSARDDDSPDDAPETPDANDKPKAKIKRKRRGRDLPREIIESRLAKEDPERQCACCDAPKAEIGFDVQERFFHQPAKVTIIEERFYKYACSHCDGGVDTCEPKLPPKPIPGSMASASMLAFLVTSKILDGLPIERVAKQLRRFGVDLATSTLNDWFGYASAFFVTIHKRLREELRGSQLISIDDTPLLALNRDHPKNIQRGRQWMYIGDKSSVIYCEYTEDWKGSHPKKVLEGLDCDIQSDGYGGISSIFKREGGPRRVGCNDHSRRKFVKALEQGDTRAQDVIDLYRLLYAVERRARKAELGVAAVLALRKSESVPIWQKLEAEVSRLKPLVGKNSPLGKAVTYFERQGPTLCVFLEDGFLPISNAHVERQIRTVAICRKNSLFVGSLEAGERFSVLLTVMLNCMLVGANPYDYMADVISKIASDWPSSRLDELLPRQWHAARQATEEQARGEAR